MAYQDFFEKDGEINELIQLCGQVLFEIYCIQILNKKITENN